MGKIGHHLCGFVEQLHDSFVFEVPVTALRELGRKPSGKL
jgi:hypothetical protein